MARRRVGQVRVRAFSRIKLRCSCGWTSTRTALRAAVELAERHFVFEGPYADACTEIDFIESNSRPMIVPALVRG